MGRTRLKPMPRSAVTHSRKVTFTVTVRRAGGHGRGRRRERDGSSSYLYYSSGGFVACVTARSLDPRLRDIYYKCSAGRNPRSAVGNAMIAAGKTFRQRKGAFQGMR